jgi:TonB-linked SusC/RagA family outer membrane protein
MQFIYTTTKLINMYYNAFPIGRFLLSLLLLFGVSLSHSLAQKPLASASLPVNTHAQDDKALNLDQVLEQIKAQHQVTFGYQENLIAGKKVKSQQWKKLELRQALVTILSPHGLEFKQLDEVHYIITRKESQKPEKLTPKKIGTDNQEASVRNKNLLHRLKSMTMSEHKVLEQTISGKVTDGESGEALPGVNVLAKGTTIGTVTDVDGNYRLSVNDNVTALVFSSIGYLTEEIPINGQSMINITMMPDIQSLSEVVVVGYGTQKREDLTGAVSSVGAETIKSLPTNTFEQALQGRVPGVQVTQGNAAPGGGMSIRIRGNSSITGNSEPLYVVDGVPIINNNGSATVGGVGGEGGFGNDQNALASLNPNDIESIEILKDASAAAIYGSRGANGVVIITTKRGKAGKPKVQFDTYAGVQEPARRLDLISPEEFATAYVEGFENAGLPPAADQATIDQFLATGGFDYQDDLFRTPSEALIQNYQLSVSGASDQGLNYFISGGYFSQDGIIKKTGFDRYSLRLNVEKTFDRFKFGNNLTVSRTNSDIIPTDGIAGVVTNALTISPILPLNDENGDFYIETIDGNAIAVNPAALIRGTTDGLQNDRLLGSIFAEYEFLEGLTFRSTLGLDVDKRLRRVYYDRNTGPRFGGTAEPGLAQQAQAQSTQVVSTNTLNFQRSFANRHNLNLTGVFETQTFERNSISMVNRGFPSDALGVDAIGSGQQEGGPNINNSRFRWQLASFVARAFYSFDNRYLLTLTGRADGSSRFGAENQWGFFPSVALGWRMDQEAFMDGLESVNELKLRASWGVTGNQEIGILQTAERLNPTSAAVFGGVFVPSVVVQSFANEELKWEETAQYNIGLSSAFFNNRLSLTADYYVKNTTDLLLNINLPISAGFTSRPAYNLGQIENRGIEIAVGGVPIQTKDFSWNIQANFTRNRNEVISIFSDRIFGPEIDAGAKIPGNLVQEGLPVGVFYGYQLDGIYSNEQEASEATVDQSGVYLQEAGEVRVIDTDGDNIITPDDRTVIGDPNPDFIYGLTSNFNWKGLSLEFTFQGVQGNDILWNDFRRTGNLQFRFDDRWTPQNTDAEYPKYNENSTQMASFYDSRKIFDGSFFRLRNVVLGYTIPATRLGTTGISGVRIYGGIANAFTITDYPGYNPDVNSFGQSAINQGIDRGSYPLARTYTLGLNLTF